MLEHSEEDKNVIAKVTENLRKLMKYKMPIDYSFISFLKRIPLFILFRKYSMGVYEFLLLLKNKSLRNFTKYAFDWHNISVVFILWALLLMADGDS